MEMIDRIKEMIGKNVFLEITGRRFYNGIIQSVNDTHIVFLDKYNEELIIAISEIKFLQPKE
jgi:small nuclear ribonucleoprotein (snRNP)-like protein